ncbi:class I SAM-dependent methyltransferase [Elusimicrobiota bacterium]
MLKTECGPGKHAAVLRIMDADVAAMDLSRENIARAKQLRKSYELNNMKFKRHDLMTPFASTEFDLISAHNWMQHSRNPSVAMHNLVSVLKIGGKFYLSLYHAKTFRFFIAQIARSILTQKHYPLMRRLVRYHFPAGFREFNNPDDIYMANIFDDFFCAILPHNNIRYRHIRRVQARA